MSDYERYGDYNSTEEDEERRPSLAWKILKIGALALLVSVCLILAARLILSGYYPRSMKSFHMTDALLAYKASHTLDVEELKVDVPFDDEDFASFCADNLLVERGAGALQFSLRFTDSTFEELARRLKISEPDYSGRSRDYFDFSLLDSLGNRHHPTYAKDDSYFWYHATKLCFDGVDFASLDAATRVPDDEPAADGAETVYLDSWIRLDVYYTGGGTAPDYSAEPYAMILIYMNVSESMQE